MKNTFLKLDKIHNLEPDFNTKISLDIQRFDDISKQSYDIQYHDVTDNIHQKLLSYIPTEFHEYIWHSSMLVMKTNDLKHIDDNAHCNINFYVETGDSITRFYEADYTGQVVNYGDTGKVFYDELNLIDQFIPKKGEIYLLNAKVPHSVKVQNVDIRSVYCLHSSLRFEEACEILRIPQSLLSY
jgi:hypothetical protein